MLFSAPLSAGFIICGLLQYIQVLLFMVDRLKRSRFYRNEQFFSGVSNFSQEGKKFSRPFNTPDGKVKRLVSFNTFVHNNHSFTSPEPNSQPEDSLPTLLPESSTHYLTILLQNLKSVLSFPDPCASFVTPVPLVSGVFLSWLVSVIYQNLSTSEENHWQRVSLYSGFALAFLGEFLERLGYLPERATIASICFALLNEIILLSSEFSGFQPKIQTRVFEFLFMSLVLLLLLNALFIFKSTLTLQVAISFCSCIHGGIFLLLNGELEMELLKESAAENIILVHFALSQLMFLFFILYFVMYFIAFKIARNDVHFINYKFGKFAKDGENLAQVLKEEELDSV